jgi:hypothetical protein
MRNLILCISTFLFSVFMPGKLNAQFKVNQFEKFYALEGTWRMPDEKGYYYEVWKIVNDIYLHGSSFKVNGTDTIPHETLQLRFNDGEITYTPTVSDQNEGKIITFRLISLKENQFVFENKNHDFPRRIVYKINNSKSMTATISGKTSKGFKKVPFVFTKTE